jgi:hypothetical protein
VIRAGLRVLCPLTPTRSIGLHQIPCAPPDSYRDDHFSKIINKLLRDYRLPGDRIGALEDRSYDLPRIEIHLAINDEISYRTIWRFAFRTLKNVIFVQIAHPSCKPYAECCELL